MAGGWKHVLLQNPVPGDVPKCLDELGVEVRKIDERTGEAEGWCPAYLERTGRQDRHPSWSVNIENGQHNCFSCGFKGPFVSLVRYVLGVSPEEAIAWVKARGSIDRARRVLGRGSYIEELVAEAVTEADLALYEEVPEWACEHRDLDPASVDHYGILWEPEKQLWITTIREPFTDRLVGWQEKAHKGRHFKNVPDHLEKSNYLFGFNQALESNACVLVESPLDVPRLHTAGLEGGVASFGAFLSDAQLDLICENFIFLVSALDNDKAGDQVNKDLRRRVNGRVRLKFWNYGTLDAKDPGEQSDEEIRESFETSYSSILARW